MRLDLIVGDYMEILMLGSHIFMLDNHLLDRRLLREVQAVDILLKQFVVHIVQRDQYGSANGLDGRVFVLLAGVHRDGDVLKTLHIELGLVAEDDGELLDQHVQDIEMADQNLLLLILIIDSILY